MRCALVTVCHPFALPIAMAHDPALSTARLLADGYCIIPVACAHETITVLNRDLAPRFAATPCCEGGFYGTRTKRFGALLRRSEHAAALVRCDKEIGRASCRERVCQYV